MQIKRIELGLEAMEFRVGCVRIAIDHVTWDTYTRHFKAKAYMGYGQMKETLDWGCLGRDFREKQKKGYQQSSVH